MAKTSAWTTRSSSPRQCTRIAYPAVAHFHQVEERIWCDSWFTGDAPSTDVLHRRRILRKRSGTADNRSQHPEGRSRFAGPPCWDLLEPPAQHCRWRDSLRRPEHGISGLWANVREFLTVFFFDSFPDACYVRRWRRMRRASHEGLSKAVVESFRRPQFNEAILLASGLLSQPATADNHLRRAAASMIMSVTYDVPPIVSELDPGVKAINDFVARIARAANPGAHLVEFFPWMRYIPSRWGVSCLVSCDNKPILNSNPSSSRFAKWKRDAEYWYEKDSAVFENLFNSVREKQVCPFPRKSETMAHATSVERHGSTQYRGNLDQGCRQVRAS